MPPSPSVHNQANNPFAQVPASTAPVKRHSGAGPIVSVVVIVVLLVFGALYFWGARLNARDRELQQLPLIPGDPASAAQ